MMSLTLGSFISVRDWHRAVIGGKDLILRRTSALTQLQLFCGYLNEKHIDVYAKQRGEYENINYCVVDTFDGIDYVCFGDVMCTSVNYTINEMLGDYDNIDEQALVQGLSDYYYTHGMSFSGLEIKPENMERFESIKDWAIEYYDEV